MIAALHHFLSGTENRSALVTPTLLPTLLLRDRPLTYPVCESAPRCSQALKETDRNDVTCSTSQENRAVSAGGQLQRRTQPGLDSALWELTTQWGQEGQEWTKHCGREGCTWGWRRWLRRALRDASPAGPSANNPPRVTDAYSPAASSPNI